MAITLTLLLVGMLLTLIIPIFLARSRVARGRLCGILFGAYLTAVSTAGIVFLLYVAVVHGGAGIGRRTLSATFLFSQQPVVATFVLLVNLACLGCLMALGWTIFRLARKNELAP